MYKEIEEAKQDFISVEGKPWNWLKPTDCTPSIHDNHAFMTTSDSFHLSPLGEKFNLLSLTWKQMEFWLQQDSDDNDVDPEYNSLSSTSTEAAYMQTNKIK